MKIHRCPENIFRMFDQEETKSAGRAAAVDWFKQQVIEEGDIVLLPDGDTGEVLSFTKNPSAS